MERIKLISISQRKFLDLCIFKLDCVSLRGLLDYGFGVKYDALKSYYSGRRLLPKRFFENLLTIAELESPKFDVLGEFWGRRIGGKKSRRKP
jgi:hypothetical protein